LSKDKTPFDRMMALLSDRRWKSPRWWLSTGRKAMALFLPSLLIFSVVEIGLRLAGYEFNPYDLHQKVFAPAGNGMVRTRFQFRTKIPYGDTVCHDQKFLAEKPDDVIRMAMVGGSNVKRMRQAEPLAVQVEKAFKKHGEFINLGFRGCGSDRALESVKEILHYEPDFILVYSGHNEFINLSNPRTRLTPDGEIASQTRISPIRLIQLLTQAAVSVQKPQEWWIQKIMRLYSEEEKEPFYQAYRENLETLIAECRKKKVPVIIGTVGYSYEFPPIAAFGYDSYEKQVAPLTPEEVESGLEKNPDNPFFLFAHGRHLVEAGQPERAKEVLDRSFVLSARPSRANRKINQILLDVATENQVTIADVRQALEDQSPHGMPGWNYFSDYCHLNDEGKLILFNVFAEALFKASLEDPSNTLPLGLDGPESSVE
jgi:lysophospholipase L1-like esterase